MKLLFKHVFSALLPTQTLEGTQNWHSPTVSLCGPLFSLAERLHLTGRLNFKTWPTTAWGEILRDFLALALVKVFLLHQGIFICVVPSWSTPQVISCTAVGCWLKVPGHSAEAPLRRLKAWKVHFDLISGHTARLATPWLVKFSLFTGVQPAVVRSAGTRLVWTGRPGNLVHASAFGHRHGCCKGSVHNPASSS